MEPRMIVRGLSKRFGDGDLAVDAVRDVDLDLLSGEVLLVMGPSGSGKTTLLLMLGAMLRPSHGSIFLDGADLVTLKERALPRLRARQLGFVFQDFNLLAALSATENVELACNLAGVTGTSARGRAVAALGSVGLSDRLRSRPHQLSGGEQQRVAIARAVVNHPAVVFADEPTANLDASRGQEVARLLHQMARSNGTSIVIVSHDERLRGIADHTVWLEDGRLRTLAAMATDPVCGMQVQPADTVASHREHGEQFWFCSTACRDDFARNPQRYLSRSGPGG